MAVPEVRRIWDPFGEMKKVQQEMDSLFERFLSGREFEGREIARAPLTNLEDKQDSFVLTAELPGLEKEDIKIEVAPTAITVKGERKAQKEEKEKNYYYSERSYSGYHRSIALPAEVNPEQVDAEYKNGVLTVTMKKINETPKKKEIKIK